eukprot:SAG22_NODE_1236_length_5055_cov_12.649593_3_plen_161_part_00
MMYRGAMLRCCAQLPLSRVPAAARTMALVIVALLVASATGAAPAACPQPGVGLPRVSVTGARATPYTLALPTLDACKHSCNRSHWCRAVVFKGVGAAGNPTCGGVNETCCYRLSTCTGSSSGRAAPAFTSYVFPGPPPPFRCRSAADCSLAGECAAGRCV